jgi:hypothetical protein
MVAARTDVAGKFLFPAASREDPCASRESGRARPFAGGDGDGERVDPRRGNAAVASEQRGTYAKTSHSCCTRRINAAGSLVFSTPPVAAARTRWARPINLRVHPALQLAGTDLPGARDPAFLSILLCFSADTEVYRRYYRRKIDCKRAFRFGSRPRKISSCALWSLSFLYPDQWLVQTSYQCEEGAGGRAYVAPPALRALRTPVAVSPDPF